MELNNDKYIEKIKDEPNTNDNLNGLHKGLTDSKPEFKLWRFMLILTSVSLLAFNSNSALTVSSIQSLDLRDIFHECTEYFNIILSRDENLRNILINLTALVQDVTLLYLVLLWLFKIQNWRFPISLVCFYSIKLLSALIFSIKSPANALWSKQIVSITFTSNTDWNFFFSGLLGLNILCYQEITKESRTTFGKVLSRLALINCFYQLFLFSTLRSNYVIDMFTSLLVGHYSTYIGESLEKYASSYVCISESDNLIKMKED